MAVVSLSEQCCGVGLCWSGYTVAAANLCGRTAFARSPMSPELFIVERPHAAPACPLCAIWASYGWALVNVWESETPVKCQPLVYVRTPRGQSHECKDAVDYWCGPLNALCYMQAGNCGLELIAELAGRSCSWGSETNREGGLRM